jgi:hypothetical protein
VKVIIMKDFLKNENARDLETVHIISSIQQKFEKYLAGFWLNMSQMLVHVVDPQFGTGYVASELVPLRVDLHDFLAVSVAESQPLSRKLQKIFADFVLFCHVGFPIKDRTTFDQNSVNLRV